MTRVRPLLAALGLVAATLIVLQAPAEAASTRTWTTVSAGQQFACAIRDNKADSLYCWGYNSDGQLGIGTAGTFRNRPQKLTGSWRSVEAGYAHACAVSKGRNLYCWGYNGSGQLGRGDTDLRTKPSKVGESWSSVSAGSSHTCGIKRNKRLYCWGYNFNGQLGDGTQDTRLTPKRIGSFTSWARVSAGTDHTCAITTAEKLYCWGAGADGQLGDGSQSTKYLPTRVGTKHDWTRVAAGANHSCGLRENERAYCWGYNGSGEIGDGSITPRATPTLVGGSNAKAWRSITVGSVSSCAVRDNRKLSCWGYGGNGRLGTGDDDNRSLPTQEDRGLTDWSGVSAGTYHACALRKNKRLYCWGDGSWGALGQGASYDDRDRPTLVK